MNKGREETVVKKVLNRGTHKVVITEENVNEALKDLHMDDESVEADETPEFFLTEQLKSSIGILEKQDIEYTQKFLKPNQSSDSYKNMQIIPWISNDIHIHIKSKENDDVEKGEHVNEESDLVESSSDYKVEEPSEIKNPLKRFI